MREHRARARGQAVVIPFPREKEEDWPSEIISKWTERARHVRAYVESGYLPIDALLEVERESFGTLTVYWAGLPPRKADEFVRQLAPQWAELTALMARNREKAKAMLAKRGG